MTYYEELGLSSTASEEDIHKAYRALSKLLHPDQQSDPELRRAAEIQMLRLNGIVEVLLDTDRRRRYDNSLVSRSTELAIPSPVAPWLKYVEPLRRGSTLVLLGTITAAVVLTLGVLWFVAGDLMHFGAAHAAAPTVGSNKPSSDAEQLSSAGRAQSKRKTTITSRKTPSLVSRNTIEKADDPEGIPAIDLPSVQTASVSQPVIATIPRASSFVPSLPTENPVTQANSSLDGLWVYTPAANKPEGNQTLLYVPEYIELHVHSSENLLFGEYTSRYRVEDKAISPYVKFTFQGAFTPTVFAWRSDDGSRGTVGLQVLSAQTLQVNWRVTQFGSSMGLAAGTAILIRKIEQ